MLNEREKEIFGRFVQGRYSMLVEKAKQKAICFLNGGNMPKKARIPALQKDPRYPDLVEKYKKDLDAFDVLTWKDSEEYPEEFVEKLMNTSDYRTFRIKNENEEERNERKRKEKEERERIKRIEERIDEYFESPEFEALAEKAQAETT